MSDRTGWQNKAGGLNGGLPAGEVQVMILAQGQKADLVVIDDDTAKASDII